MIDSGALYTRSPMEQVIRLQELKDEVLGEFPTSDILGISNKLASVYDLLEYENPKAAEINRILCLKRSTGEKVRLLTTKASYACAAQKVFSEFADVLSVSTLSDALGADVVDCAIISATPNYRQDGFSPYSLEGARETIVLEYPSEQKKNQKHERTSEEVLSRIGKAAMVSSKRYFSVEIEEPTEVTSEQQENNVDNDLEEQLSIIETDLVISRIVHVEPGNAVMRAHRLIHFASGDWAFLSKYYEPFLLDESKGLLVTKSVEELKQGDIMVFSTKSEAVTDFVGQMLERLIEKNATMNVHYDRSKRWKTTLKRYMDSNGQSFADISKLMGDLGHPRHHVTIASWLREDSSIIGPRDEEAFLAIGLVTEDEDISNHAEEYKRSCDIIRNQRTRILSYVQSSIIKSVLPDCPQSSDESLSDEEKALLGDVNGYARKLVIERVDPYEQNLPSHMVNRILER